MEAVTIEDIHIQPGKLTACVRVAPDARRTDERIARRVLHDHPDLARHSCVNDKGPAFASVIADTSVPHLLEHIVIDRQVAEEPPESRITFTGHTTWISEDAGLASIVVNFRSDACALRALAYACSYFDSVMKEET